MTTEGTVTAVAQQDLQPPRHRWLALCVLLLAAAMELLDTTIVNVALPAIDADVGAGSAVVEWLVAGYTLAFAVMLITGGRLGDVFGRRRVFLVGVVGFTMASLLCGLAQAPGQLVAFRIAQGGFAALMVPQVLAMIRAVFPANEQPKAYGLYGAFVGLATVSGPIVGGALVQADLFGLSWRPIFLVNVPVGLLALIGAAALMPESTSQVPRRFDLGGVALLSTALLLVVYPLVQATEHGWTVPQVVLAASAAPALALFGLHQRTRTNRGDVPLVPLTLFANRSFTGGVLVSLAFFSGVGGLFLGLTITLQHDLGFSPIRTGLTFLPWSVGIFVASGVSVQLVSKLGRRLILIGTLAMVAGAALLAWTVHRNGLDLAPLDLAPGLLVAGLGMGMVAPTIIDVVLGGGHATDAGAASGVLNTALQLGSALGVATLGLLFFARHGHHVHGHLQPDGLPGLEAVMVALIGIYVISAILTAALLPAQRSMIGSPSSRSRASTEST